MKKLIMLLLSTIMALNINYNNILPLANSNNIKKINNNIFMNNNKWNIHKNMLFKIEKFKAKGIIKYNDGIKELFIRFNLNNYKKDHFVFKAYNYLGIKVVDFTFSSKDNILNIKNKNSLEKYIINNLPINNLNTWIIGLPGDSKKIKFNSSGYLKEIECTYKSKIFRIKYKNYFKNTNPALPNSIELIQNNNNNNNLKLKIESWHFSN